MSRSRFSRAVVVAALSTAVIAAASPHLFTAHRWPAVRQAAAKLYSAGVSLQRVRALGDELSRLPKGQAGEAAKALEILTARGVPAQVASEHVRRAFIGGRFPKGDPLDVTAAVNGTVTRKGAATHPSQEVENAYPAILAASRRTRAAELVESNVVAEVAVLDVLPRDANEFSKVFNGRQASQGALDELSAARMALSQSLPPPRTFAGAIGFTRALEETSEKIVLVIGHNENGLLRTPAGYWLDLGVAADLCGAYGKLCVFLSCSSGQFVGGRALGVQRNISAREAVFRAKEIRDRILGQPRQKTHDDLVFDAEFTNRPDRYLQNPEEAIADIRRFVAQQDESRLYGYATGGLFVTVAMSMPAGSSPQQR